MHGESGVAEGSYEFWKTVFDGVRRCGRKVEIDMHAKGMDQGMIDTALAAGQPVKISPKYWAEHLGMPYHQADIREQERPRAGHAATGLMKPQRRFAQLPALRLRRPAARRSPVGRAAPHLARYAAPADLGRPASLPPATRAPFPSAVSDGVEIMEPLSFKGRRGSGIAGGRCAYADKSLNPRWDWEKYAYSYRVWGRNSVQPGDRSRRVAPGYAP